MSVPNYMASPDVNPVGCAHAGNPPIVIRLPYLIVLYSQHPRGHKMSLTSRGLLMLSVCTSYIYLDL